MQTSGRCERCLEQAGSGQPTAARASTLASHSFVVVESLFWPRAWFCRCLRASAATSLRARGTQRSDFCERASARSLSASHGNKRQMMRFSLSLCEPTRNFRSTTHTHTQRRSRNLISVAPERARARAHGHAPLCMYIEITAGRARVRVLIGRARRESMLTIVCSAQKCQAHTPCARPNTQHDAATTICCKSEPEELSC